MITCLVQAAVPAPSGWWPTPRPHDCDAMEPGAVDAYLDPLTSGI